MEGHIVRFRQEMGESAMPRAIVDHKALSQLVNDVWDQTKSFNFNVTEDGQKKKYSGSAEFLLAKFKEAYLVHRGVFKDETKEKIAQGKIKVKPHFDEKDVIHIVIPKKPEVSDSELQKKLDAIAKEMFSICTD
jgi:hypothetical protein